VVGPLISRRLGHSLGINLLPLRGKVCTFDCIYCECGWNKDHLENHEFIPYEKLHEVIRDSIAIKAKNNIQVDSITFSGNGEPTLHPDFPEIVELVLELRNLYYPNAKVSVLSNATTIGREKIFNALTKVDNPIMKLDGVDENFIKLINGARDNYSIVDIVKNMHKFNGNFIIQTMFLKGTLENGNYIDSTLSTLVKKWIDIVLELKPREVMVYTIDRDTPNPNLEKVTIAEMKDITNPLRKAGISVQISG